MHTDAQTLEDGTLIEGDICIVGAGVAGIMMAVEWMNTKQKVILLEGGGFDFEDKIQDLYNGKITGHKYFPLKTAALHYFGGSSGHWGGMCSVFDPVAFQKREWVDHSGWPISQDDLMPFYERANPYFDLGTYSFDVGYWQSTDPGLVTFPLDKNVIWNKIWRFSPPTRFGGKFRDTIVKAENIHLYTYANVVDVVANENVSEIQYVLTKNLAGKGLKVKARYFVFASGGIQNARILLASNRQAPKGLGNDNDNVGRYFMEQLDVRYAELWLKKPMPLKFYLFEYPRPRTELAITTKKMEEMRMLIGNVSFAKLDSERDALMEEQNKKESSDEAGSKGYKINMRLEQAPNPLSRVTLSGEKDALGMFRPILNWTFTPLERHTIRTIYKILGQQFGAAGLGRVRIYDEFVGEEGDLIPEDVIGGWHHMGTTRMSADPKTGVVDANGKVYGIKNLYMAGSSCFPTGAGVNPTFTIGAMALRLSDHLKQVMAAVN